MILGVQNLLGADLGGAGSFVYTVCDPQSVTKDFAGQLGRFTPCFIDIVVLGVAHAAAIALYSTWLAFARGGVPDRFRLKAGARGAARAQAAAAALCALVPLFELNGRMAQQGASLLGGAVAPHEVAGLLLAATSFGLLAAACACRAGGHFIRERRWLLAAPLLVVASAELVKLRFVIELLITSPGDARSGDTLTSYFFVMYTVYVIVQCVLAASLAAWHPAAGSMTLVEAGRGAAAAARPRRAGGRARGGGGGGGGGDGRGEYARLPGGDGGGGGAATGGAAVCPEARAGLWSLLTFGWMNPLVKIGSKRPLEADDMWQLPPGDRVEVLEEEFLGAWQRQIRERGSEGASLLAASWAVVGRLFWLALPFKLVNDASQFLGPTILNALLAVVSGQAAADARPAATTAAADEAPAGGGPVVLAAAAAALDFLKGWWGALDARSQGYLLALGLFSGTLVGSLADAQHYHALQRAGFRLKALFMAETQRKVLSMSPAARARFGSGRVYNMVTSDTQMIQDFCMNAMGAVSSPLRITFAMALLWRQLGAASLVAVACIAATVPVNSYLVGATAGRLRKALAYTDERARIEGELVTGIEVVKASTWEAPFTRRIGAVRSMELAQLQAALLMQNIIGFLVNAVPTLVPVASFAAYLFMGRTLTASEAFTSLSLFQVLRFPLFQLPQLVTQATQARVALTRLQQLLSAEEVTHTSPPPPPPPPPRATTTTPPSAPAAGNGAAPAAAAGAGAPALSLHGDFAWDPDRAPALEDIGLDVPEGSLVAVVGSTGAGKSSLLMAALGQMPQARGPPPTVRGRVAFVPQAPFVLAGSVRDNILFGRPFDAARYSAAIRAACLEPDLEALAAGDATELGERGTNISGGQKQRISIARAVYADASVVLLDDPLSALDARVARRVYDLSVRQALRGKTVVLATNQLQFATHPGVDKIIYMKDGRVAESGTLSDLMAAPSGGFASLVKETQLETEGADGDADPDGGEIPGGGKGGAAAKGGAAEAAGAVAPAPGAPPAAGAAPQQGGQGQGRLVQAESSASGRVSSEVLAAYARACGGWVVVALLFSAYVIGEALRVGTTLWLSYWTSHVDDPDPAHTPSYYMGWYAVISVFQLLSFFLSIVMSFRQGLRAGARLHDAVLASLLAAPVSFYHTTPSGRIINRLTKDTSEVDQNLASNISFALRCGLQLVSTLALIGAGAPFALPALVVLMLAFYRLYEVFQASMMQVKRLDATSRSPVLSSVSEALAGVATIRAFGVEGALMARHARLVDANAAMALANQGLNRWLGVRLEALGALSTFVAALVSVEQLGSGTASTAAMGLLISYALQITVTTSLTLRMGAIAEQSFNAVERLHEYSTLPQEAPAVVPGSAPEGWPSQGEVEFRDVRMRYRPGLPLVLRGLTFHIPPRYKVGVVGRTGAGKSSVIGALFRLMEAEGGSILLDGIETRRVGLRRLRSSMALIPQVPVLFAGTIRVNLSPFGEHSDAELWSALRRAHLAPLVESLGGGLDHALAESGAPLSAGQKQLLALARAVLSPAKVLVLDEATANVDVETDALIQTTMATEFSDRTIIAVAHRLLTIIGSDRVLVLDQGRAAEYDSPKALLDIPNGAFASMVRETGAATEAFLRAAASGDKEAMSELDAAAQSALAAVACAAPEAACLSAISADLASRAAAVAAAVRRALAGAAALGGDEARASTLLPKYVGMGAGDDMAASIAAARQQPAGEAAAAAAAAFDRAASGGAGAAAGEGAGGGGAPAAEDVAAAAAALRAALASLDQLSALADAATRLAGGRAASGGAPGDDAAPWAWHEGGGGSVVVRRSWSLRPTRRARGTSLELLRPGAGGAGGAGAAAAPGDLARRSRSMSVAAGAAGGEGCRGLLARCELEAMASRELPRGGVGGGAGDGAAGGGDAGRE